jgi:hypothetical protein
MKKQKIKISKALQKAIDDFPKTVKAKEKAAKERKRIMKNFASVADNVYKK